MIKNLSKEAAKADGYVPMTDAYRINCKHDDIRERDRRWLDSVLWDMRGANIVTVDVPGGIEVWRKKSELKKIPKE